MLKIKSKRQGAELTSILKDGNEMLFDGKTFWFIIIASLSNIFSVR